MSTNKGQAQRTGHKECQAPAEQFLEAFNTSAVQSKTDLEAVLKRGGASMGAGGVVEFTDEVIETLGVFVHCAAGKLGSKAANEDAIRQIALREGQNFVALGGNLAVAATALVNAVFESGRKRYEYVAPNYLVRFSPGIAEVVIGRIRAMPTAAFAAERASRYPDDSLQIVQSDSFALTIGPTTLVHMPPVCWIVDVAAVLDNVEEEAKWLVDVGVGLLRLAHNGWDARFPRTGDREPHPLRLSQFVNVGVKFEGSKAHAGGGKSPAWYQIDQAAVDATNDAAFKAKAALIFDAASDTLAGRIGQGLGWMTRGRQAEDRAERLLYFITAVEALLTRDDKSAPVVQTIARHASVLLSNDNEQRFAAASWVKKLYESRSSLVHSGSHSILWSAANSAQVLAEQLYIAALERADLRVKHATFCDELGAASYGTPWPPLPHKEAVADYGNATIT